ncbi:MAG: hypothetical protein JWM95_31 [Gemmatimonadetes bacterium]|nr:hypothetical protein [Gemmatimonadota bacterium]
MTGIPNAVLSQHVRESLSGRCVTAAVFMTYTLEPEFFEEEIVTLLAGDALLQEPKLRLWQLEEALRGAIGPIAVYYDQVGLRPDAGKKLDIRYVPVRAKSGVFHPKLVLLLTVPTDDGSKLKPALVCGVLSANLTKSGWWSSLEAAHFEFITAGDRCSFRDDLRRFLKEVRQLGGRDQDHEPLDAIDVWLRRETQQTEHRTTDGRLRPQLIAGTRPLLEFLRNTRGDELTGASLEVISPFLDEKRPSALSALIDAFGIRETRVFLPAADDGTANVEGALYDEVRSLPGCSWGRLPPDLLKLGKETNALSRGVHAKVYRFLKRSKRYEAILVGSHNLSVPAHGAGRNVEASFLIERESSGAVDWWLTTDTKRPRAFKVDLGDEDVNMEAFVPLQVSYDWTTQLLEVRWGGKDVSPRLRVESAGSEIFTLENLGVGEWTSLDRERAIALEKILISTTLLQVVHDDGSRGSILVQEYGMNRKPSLVVSWTIADVLEYWSRLTAEQKAAFLLDRGGNIPEGFVEGAERTSRLERLDNFFTTLAGIFHGFEMLRKQVLSSIEAGHERQADYLLFGKRHDSLPVLVDRIIEAEGETDVLQSYLLLLSTRQLARELRNVKLPFFEAHRSEFNRLIDRTKHAEILSAKLELGSDGQAFITWFEGHFLKNLRLDEASVA